MAHKKNEPSGNKILMIVDDDIDDRFFFRNAIRKYNPSYKCVEAENGDDALKRLRKVEALPDFIFLDLNMPKMDGRECLIELKKDELLKNIPVIIYSSSENIMDKEMTNALGADYFLTKLSHIYSLPEELINAMNQVGEKTKFASP
ncbi:CheY-like chemotaxis protein [Gelidibacter algens]|uniref:CheY-like chemotaxis protein n=1 Tax=Gelidibacter algens TaxID=49280 RepID=A0A327RRZ9_9FLAO|nr:response regulator [Gelidibacter algens]RAJ19766.1 CheY-like chemotaxis protein [Gelidibacter algens]